LIYLAGAGGWKRISHFGGVMSPQTFEQKPFEDRCDAGL
jgi:hypothetical protein